jgi:hypothetical protein
MGIGVMFARQFRIAALLLAGVAAAALDIAPARAASWFEMNFWMGGPRYSGALPACDSTLALAEIQSRFAAKERRFWHSNLQLVSFDRIRETAYRPWSSNTIPRRFCSGRVQVSDGVWRPVHYFIAEDQAMIGLSWGVEWCVVGLDRNWANNPVCRMAQP